MRAWQAFDRCWLAATVVSLCLLLFTTGAHAAKFVFHDRSDGISCHYFDVGLGVPWPHDRPEGADAENVTGGSHPYASMDLDANDRRRVLRIDVTTLVRTWLNLRYENDGLLLRLAQGSFLSFHARETDDASLRPQLLLSFANGKRRYIEARADASLDCSSLAGLGKQATLILKATSPLALHFDLDSLAASDAPTRAELTLVRSGETSSVRSTLEVLRMIAPIGSVGAPRLDGIASGYLSDAGIAAHPEVLFADTFDARSLDHRWTRGMAAPSERVERDPENGFEPLAGPAYRITIPGGHQLGLDLRYRFKAVHGSEPDEIYFRYYLRFARDWLSASDGGKLPGLAGTYGLAAWGGRPWDGYKGWSMRGAYHVSPPAGHPGHGRFMLGTYAYHSRADKFGAPMSWPGAALAALVEPDRWYCIEQHLKLNMPGREDGLFQVWVDGQQVVERDDLRLRDASDIHIEEVWMNFFHGGTAAPPRDMHAYIDGVVVARKYIGPMSPRMEAKRPALPAR